MNIYNEPMGFFGGDLKKKLWKKFNVKFCVLLKKNFYLYKMKMLNTKKTLVWTHQGKNIYYFLIVKISCHKNKMWWWFWEDNVKVQFDDMKSKIWKYSNVIIENYRDTIVIKFFL
jgi:hypothetical protein